VETSKALTDLLAPLSGTVVEANLAVQDAPEMLTRDPYGTGWLIMVEPSEPGELDLLMTPQRYRELMEGEC
jgi:glycine cleavage system H protein